MIVRRVVVGKVQNVGMYAEPKGEDHHFHTKEVCAGKYCREPNALNLLDLGCSACDFYAGLRLLCHSK